MHTPHELWALLQAAACTTTTLSLLAFQRGQRPHKYGYACAAWLLIVMSAAVLIKLACGVRPPPGPLEALSTVLLAVVLIVHRGNLAEALRATHAACARLLHRQVRR